MAELTAFQKREMAKKLSLQEVFSACFLSFLNSDKALTLARQRSIADIVTVNPTKTFVLSVSMQFNTGGEFPALDIGVKSFLEDLNDGD